MVEWTGALVGEPVYDSFVGVQVLVVEIEILKRAHNYWREKLLNYNF